MLFKTSPMMLRSWDVQRQASRLPSLRHPQSQIGCRTPFQHSPTHSDSSKDQPINSRHRCLPSFAWQFMQPELHGTSPKHDHHTLPWCSAAEYADGQFQVAFLQNVPRLPGGHLYCTPADDTRCILSWIAMIKVPHVRFRLASDIFQSRPNK
jgi:hypothetical protein